MLHTYACSYMAIEIRVHIRQHTYIHIYANMQKLRDIKPFNAQLNAFNQSKANATLCCINKNARAIREQTEQCKQETSGRNWSGVINRNAIKKHEIFYCASTFSSFF